RRQRAAAFGDEASMWRRMSAPRATELLFRQNGEAEALKIARLELRKARRARSRKRFDFWTAVAQEMQVARGGSGEIKGGADEQTTVGIHRNFRSRLLRLRGGGDRRHGNRPHGGQPARHR